MEEEKGVPDTCYRGLTSEKHLMLEGRMMNINGVSFGPSDFLDHPGLRTSKCKELSVNWNDDDGSIKNLFEQENSDGTLHFPAGAARISLSRLKQNLSVFITDKTFDYERRAIEGNPYHGNFLIADDVDKEGQKTIKEGIRFACEKIIPNPNTKVD